MKETQNLAQVQAMQESWAALEVAKQHALTAYGDQLLAIERFEGATFLATVQAAKRAGLAKFVVSRATGVRSWPKIREWWGDDDTPATTKFDRVSVLTVDGMTLHAMQDPSGVMWVEAPAEGFSAWFGHDGLTVEWWEWNVLLTSVERADKISAKVEEAVLNTNWVASLEG